MNLDPSAARVAVIAILVFTYSFTATSGIMTVLQDRMPYPNEWLYFLFFALGTVAIYMLTFLGFQKPPET